MVGMEAYGHLLKRLEEMARWGHLGYSGYPQVPK